MSTKDFLLELGCEELPPKLLTQLSRALMQNLSKQLSAADLTYNKVTPFATPRRLAVLVQGLQTQQNDQNIERKGPAVSASEQAIQGFAKSCGVSISHLEQKSLAKADYYYFTKCKKGLKTADLLADIVSVAIKKIPISKPMRWGSTDFSFVRPLHWLVILLGSEVINATIMGLKSGNTTRGMRFAGERIFNIANANDYQKTLLDKAQIQVNFDTRRTLIRTQIEQVAADNNATVVIDEILLDEVCALVEHPLAFAGKFDVKFLDMPKEVLISAMKLHQKYFHIVDDKGQLLPGFIAVANIRANDLAVIIDGNQRVIRPRLSDAQFFWTKDKAISSTTRLQKLDKVLFMDGLGQMADKARRIEALSGYIATELGENVTNCKRAGLLCKSDLVSDMVGEFADLQGVMGGYYAHNDGESVAVSKAISEHYHPRFSGDSLPSTPEGLVVAIADKVDNIVGIYGMGHKPTGSKDPYALKRAGLGLLRIMIEGKLLLNLSNLITQSVNLYNFGQDKSKEIYVFIVERLETYYSEKNIDKCILKAVLAAAKNNPDVKVDLVYDWHLRIMALNIFMQNEDFNYLIEANKRIKNILKGHKIKSMALVEKTNLVKKTTQFDADLYDATTKAYNVFNQNKYKNYQAIIEEFLQLKTVIDDFFDNVMVNDDDLEIRKLRLNNINRVRQLFLCVADITYLAK